MVNFLENQIPTIPITNRRESSPSPPPRPPIDINMLNAESGRLHWQHCLTFLMFWLLIYAFVVFCNNFPGPRALSKRDECRYPDKFISERAGRIFFDLADIGPHEVGSEANEKHAVNLLLFEIEKVKNLASTINLYNVEFEVQKASGSFIHWDILNSYEDIQNVVVLITPRSTNSSSYLLINSHFDTVPRSPGAGDASSMVAIMLEVMRSIVMTSDELRHPIVFLFNGAEENSLQGSHAFMAQHKWANNVKAVINLDSAGAGGREMLFQSGPNHPWLMKYYRRSALHPFASTLAEEIYQSGVIPSDTDFSIFKKFNVPGLDMAYSKNGYVYHTPYDSFEKVPLQTLQNTGNNVLAIARVIASSFELENPSDHKDGYMIFYDILGLFLAMSTEFQSMVFEVILVGSAIFAIFVSLWQMRRSCNVHIGGLTGMFLLVCIIQILSLAFAIGITIFIAITMDSMNYTMSWFYHSWILFGLYVCPMIFGLGILPPIFLALTKMEPITISHKVKMFQHAHCLMLIILIPIFSTFNIRSAYLLNIAVGWYTLSVIINLALDLHNYKNQFLALLIILQIIPFIYFCYITETILGILIPMQGRSGNSGNPELQIAGICGVYVFLCHGFLIPLFGIFEKARLFVLGFLLICLSTIFLIMFTPLGFPYSDRVAPQRFQIIHTRRVFHDYNQTVRKNEPAYYFWPQDRNFNKSMKTIMSYDLNQTLLPVEPECSKEMFCGFPLLHHKWNKAKKNSFYIPTKNDPNIDEIPKLEKLKSSLFSNNTMMKYEFTLNGPDHMAIFIKPFNSIHITNWSFNTTMLEENWAPPYFIYLRFGISPKPYNFFLEFKTDSMNTSNPIFEIGISAHWVHQPVNRHPDYQKFIDRFPRHAVVIDWISSYETWIY